jgi:hypothetical protein
MMEDGEDFTMFLSKSAQLKLITRDMAVTLTQALVESRYGRAELEAQSPFVASENDDSWIIEGSREYAMPSAQEVERQHAEQSIDIVHGKVEVINTFKV